VLHDLLKRQLEELGIADPTTPPDPETWRWLLEAVTESYHRADDRLVYHALFEQTNDAVFIIDFNGKYLASNRKAAEMLGYSVIEVVGLSIREVVAPEQLPDSQTVLQALIEGKPLAPYERLFRKKDGTVFPVEVNVQLVYDNLGAPLYIQSVVRDITERKRTEAALREREALYRTLVRNIPNVVVLMFDRDFRYILAEGALFRHGYSKETYEGKTIWEAISPERQEIYLPYYRAALTGQESQFEIERDGFIYQVHIVPIRDENGTIIAGMNISEDITERKQAEAAIRFQAALVDHMHDAVIATDNNYRVITWNQGAERIYGWSADEAIGRDVNEVVISSLTLEQREEAIRVLVQTGHWEREVILPHRSGKPINILSSVSLLRDNNGQPIGLIGIDRDITERKRAEAQMRALIDAIPDMIVRHDREGRYLQIKAVPSIPLNYAISDAIGRTVWEMLTHNPDLAEGIVRSIEKVLDTREIDIQEFKLSVDGQIFYREARTVPTDADEVLMLIRDITARKQAEEALQHSEEKYRQLFNAAQWQAQELTLLNRVRAAVAQEMDLAPLIRAVVKTIAEIFNYTYVSLYLLEGDKLVLYHQIGYEPPIPVIPLNKGIIGRTARIGEPVFVENISDDPDYLSAEDGIASEICVPLFDRDQVVGVFNVESKAQKALTNDDMRLMIALSEQVSIAIERARLYTSLRESKEQYQNVIDSVREVIFQTDARGCWSFLNPAWIEITGFSITESLGQPTLDIVHPDDRPLTAGQYRLLVKGETPFSRYETRILTKDGGTRWVEVHARPTAYVQGQMLGLSGTLTDITERKRSEQQAAELLAQSRTVDALRRFLNNVSHDLRTPLSVMNTSLYLLRRKFADPDTAVRHLNVLEEQVSHLTRIVEDLVEMSRLEDRVVEFEFIPVHLGNLVRDVMISYETIAQNKRLTIRRECDPGLPRIRADQVWLGRLVHNLLTNAVQYTPNGGTIHLRTSSNGDGVLLEVQDTGIGISPEDLPFIFDRFYRADAARPSTKGGAGLGLAIVRKVVDAHGGRVEVESVVGEGSTFRVWFPVSGA